MKQHNLLIIIMSLLLAGSFACRKKYEYPLHLPQLFEGRLSELGVSQVGVSYLKAVDDCVHWGGEEPYNAERAKEMKEGIERDCGLAKRLAMEFQKSNPDPKSKELVSKVAEDLQGGVVDVFELNYFIWQDPEKKSKVMKSYYDSRVPS